MGIPNAVLGGMGSGVGEKVSVLFDVSVQHLDEDVDDPGATRSSCPSAG